MMVLSKKATRGVAQLRVCTWNVSTQTGKLLDIISFAVESKMDMVFLQETRHTASSAKDMRLFAASNNFELTLGSPQTTSSGSAGGGFAVLSRWPVQRHDILPVESQNFTMCVCVHRPCDEPILVSSVHLHPGGR